MELADAQMPGNLYKLFIQAVLLFSLETWVVTPCIGRMLGGFHHRVSRRLTGNQPWIRPGESW